MSTVFIKLLNMSITASWMILAVILARLLLKKTPKWITCLLWGLVAVRLICPFSFESIFSLIPSSQTIPSNIALQQEPAINSGITIVNETINPIIAESFTPTSSNSANPLQIIIPVASIIWIVGIVILLAYALISYLRLKKSVSVCVPVKEGILSCDEVKAPFILGVFRPIIYVPSSMNGETLDYVLRHESAHLQRRDHWWKPLGFLLLSVYWFNPLCWIAYILLCRDIEMACDEKVIRDMDKGDMAAYSQALLDCSFPRKRIAACPLAFGEVGVKERVKGVLNYKKPAFWIILIAIIACVVLAVCLMTDPSSGRKISFGNVQLSWAKALDLRPNEQTTRDLTEDELEELKSRLAVLKIGKRDDNLVGFTPFYSLSVYASQTGQFLIASFDYEGNNIGIMYQNHYYRIHDDGFADYLSKVCAGNITVDSPFEAEIDVASLKAKYPEYFDLDTFKGLEVYVWQMASDSYSFGVMSGTNREKTLEELMSLKGASLEEMRIILSTYDIAQEDVSIIPCQNPISSYLGEYGIILENEDPASAEKQIKEYAERIRQMLFGNIKGQDLIAKSESPDDTYTVYANSMSPNTVFQCEISGGGCFRLVCSDPAGGLMEKQLEYQASEAGEWEVVGDLTSIIPNYPQAMTFPDEKTGIILTDYHRDRNNVFITRDGGHSWTGEYLGEEADLYTNGIDLTYDLENDMLWMTVSAKVSDDEYEERVYSSEDLGYTWSRSE